MKKHWVFRDSSSGENVTEDKSAQDLLKRLIGKGLCVSLLLAIPGCGAVQPIDLPTTKTIPPTEQGEIVP
jgi:hypothetical protein